MVSCQVSAVQTNINTEIWGIVFRKKKWLGLVVFYGASTFVGYLMPNPIYTHI